MSSTHGHSASKFSAGMSLGPGHLLQYAWSPICDFTFKNSVTSIYFGMMSIFYPLTTLYDCFSPWIISTHVEFLLEKIFIISIYSFLTYFISLCKILYKFCFQGICWGTSLVVQWLRIHLPMHGTWVQSLVRKLRSHTSGATKVGCCNYRAHMLWSPCSTATEAASSHNKRLTCHK